MDALLLESLEAWWILGIESCRGRAQGILDLLWDTHRTPGGGMYHYWDGMGQAPGMLMDAVMTAQAEELAPSIALALCVGVVTTFVTSTSAPQRDT